MSTLFRVLPAVLFIAACNDPVSTDEWDAPDMPRAEEAVVVVSSDTGFAVIEKNGLWMEVVITFPVELTNTGTDTLQITHCSTVLEGERNGRWYGAGAVGCFLTVPTVAEIAPGATYSFKGRVSSTYSGPYRTFGGSLPGLYRYTLSVRRAGRNEMLQAPPSNTFVVVRKAG